jgi:hypothetical protein
MARAFLNTLIALALFLVLPLAAQAQTIDSVGAAHLKTMVTNFLNQQKSINEALGGVEYQFDGEVLVEPAGTYYAVTLPHIKYVYPDGGVFDMGIIAINATPHTEAGQWKMTLAIPTPLVFKDAAGAPQFTVNIGAQRAAGLWDEDFGNFFKFDAVLENVTGKDSAGEVDITLPKITLQYDLTKDAKGLWSGPGSAVISQARVDGPDQANIMTADTLAIRFSLDEYNPGAVRTYQEQFTALMENAPALSPGAPMSAEHSAALYNMIQDMMLKSSNGFSVTYTLSGLKISYTEIAETPEAAAPPSTKTTLADAGLTLGMNGFFENAVTFDLKAQMKGLTSSDLSPEEQAVTPQDFALNLSVQKIPLKEIAELGKSTMEGSLSGPPEIAGLGWMALALKLPAFLSQAGTEATIKDSFIAGKDFRLDLTGTAKADLMAVNSATANAKGVFKGLDSLIKKMEAINTEVPNETLSGLKTFKQYAREENAPRAAPLHIIDLVMDEKGQILLNGKPWSMMDGAASPSP